MEDLSDPDDDDLLEHAFELIMPLWQSLDVLDDVRRVTALGRCINGLGPAQVRSSSITGTGPAGTLADAIVTQAASAVVEVMDTQITGSMYAVAAY